MSKKNYRSFSKIVIASVLCLSLCLLSNCDVSNVAAAEETTAARALAEAEARAARAAAEAAEARAELAAQRAVQTISSGDVFLMLWHNGQFRKFNRSQVRQLDRAKPVVVLVHGLFESATDDWLANMARRIATVEPNTLILAVDWSKFSLKGSSVISWEDFRAIEARWGNEITLTFRPQGLGAAQTRRAQAVANVVRSIPPVADLANEYLFGGTGLQLRPASTHIIGFSHGAHVAGLIGENTGGTLRRLTVLDPSTRLSHFAKNGNRGGKGWDSQSARFIDMYQTSRVLGTSKPYGHMSWEVVAEGDGRRLPTISFNDRRRHNYAPTWFTTTVGNRNLGHGYSMAIPANVVQEGKWSGTIIGR